MNSSILYFQSFTPGCVGDADFGKLDMAKEYKSLFTPQNCAVVFIDHQPQMAFGVQSIDRQALINNVSVLAEGRLQEEKLAPEFGVEEWIIEAGPKFFEEAVLEFGKAVAESTAALYHRSITTPEVTRA